LGLVVVQSQAYLRGSFLKTHLHTFSAPSGRGSGERKAKREARIAELKADQKRRSDLLKKAWELTKEAVSA